MRRFSQQAAINGDIYAFEVLLFGFGVALQMATVASSREPLNT